MRANPGGEIAPEDVVGRDRLIARLWETLTRQSVILVAERRMGKSCVVKKMLAERAPQKSWPGRSSPRPWWTRRMHGTSSTTEHG